MILCFPQVHHNHTINYHFPLNNNMFVYLFIWKSAALMEIYYKLFSSHFITSRSHSINKGQLFFLFFPMEMVSSTRMKCACSYKKKQFIFFASQFAHVLMCLVHSLASLLCSGLLLLFDYYSCNEMRLVAHCLCLLFGSNGLLSSSSAADCYDS
jgi:hypothetical protein